MNRLSTVFWKGGLTSLKLETLHTLDFKRYFVWKSIKEVMYLIPKIGMFCALSQKYKHLAKADCSNMF